MALEYKIYLERAENELRLAQIINQISNNKKTQTEIFKSKEDTYYSAVISHAYYAIFYAAKAYLHIKNIKVSAPEEHKKTYEALSEMVKKGFLDVELLKLYKKTMIQADTLLKIFQLEKSKRGTFTYKKIPQANKEPAKESLNNATIFFKNIFLICEKQLSE